MVSVKSPPSGGDLSAGRRVPVPPHAHAGGLGTPSAPEPDHQTTGATRAAGARTAHGAASGCARPEAGRQTAETAGMQGRAPLRATDQQSAGTRTRPVPPAKISARGEPAEVRPMGKGKRPRRARRGRAPRETERPASAPRHGRRCGHRPSKRPEASRGRAAGGRKGHAPSPSRGRMKSAASGQADQTDVRRGASSAREQLPPPRAPETARPRQRTAKRRRGGRGDGAGRGGT